MTSQNQPTSTSEVETPSSDKVSPEEKGPKASSTVWLTSFALYRTRESSVAGQPTVEVLYGASDARFNPGTGKIELLAESIPFHSDSFKPYAPKPGHGMLMLYGIRDTLDELHKWRTMARELKCEFASAEFEFEVGTIEKALTGVELLRKTRATNRFLNVRRMKSDLQKVIFDRFQAYAAEESRSVETDMLRVSQMATRPNYFDRVFQDYKDLQGLDILVIPVADSEIAGRPHIRQAAYVRPSAKLVNVKQGRHDADIVLPAWLGDRKAAEKQRKFAEATD